MKKFIFPNGEVHITFIANEGYNYKAYAHGLTWTDSKYGYAVGTPTEEAARAFVAELHQPSKPNYAPQWVRAQMA